MSQENDKTNLTDIEDHDWHSRVTWHHPSCYQKSLFL